VPGSRNRMNTRRKLIVALVLGPPLVAPLAAFAQASTTRVARVGFLSPQAQGSISETRPQAFREGMRALGYVEGKNLQIDVRWAGGDLDRLPALATELAQLKVDVIVASTSPVTLAAHRVAPSLPIVTVASDPVGDGLVASLARPGGNITGVSQMAPELGEKRLQLLHDMFPQASHAVAVLWNPAYIGMRARFEQAKVAAPTVGLTVESVELEDAGELSRAFDAIVRDHPDALLLLFDPLTFSLRARIVEFAAQQRMPAIYESSDFVDAGGLLSYGPDYLDLYRRAATFVDKILKGAKPADLPIEQPTKFDLVLNLKAAKALGITFPAAILLRADRVIE
jgi:putative ABC transport system substrate-binding protein